MGVSDGLDVFINIPKLVVSDGSAFENVFGILPRLIFRSLCSHEEGKNKETTSEHALRYIEHASRYTGLWWCEKYRLIFGRLCEGKTSGERNDVEL
mmetsp:Transcript_47429/g.71809  ORF Transcript_47429/g.71809 Transcript_47429/m.71809 type:complete len:96 (+) Transcript_47429:1833-2120(+)